MNVGPILSESASERRHPTTFAGIVGIVPVQGVDGLQKWVDPRLELVEPGKGFFKFYQLRRRLNGSRLGVRFLHYQQVCFSALARYRDGEPMHVNFVMWEDEDWAALANRAAMGWPKRYADIAGTWLFPHAGADLDAGWDQYDVSIVRHGVPVLEMVGTIHQWGEAPPPPRFDGFLTVRPPMPFGGDSSSPLIQVRPYGWISEPIGSGNAVIELSRESLPDEAFALPELVGDDHISGPLGIHHIRWTIDPSINRVLEG